jgi:hypothetical protein
LFEEQLLHACVRLRCYKPPLTDEEKAERKAAAKKRKSKKKDKVKSEESESEVSPPKNLGYNLYSCMVEELQLACKNFCIFLTFIHMHVKGRSRRKTSDSLRAAHGCEILTFT